MMKDAADNYEVIVAGGGPGGTSAAIHLALRGARVLLVEREKFPRAKLCGEFITPECVEHFAELGVAERMSGAGGREVGETIFYTQRGNSIAVPSKWFGGGGGAGRAALGLSRAEMDARMLARAREVGVEVLEETDVAGLLFDEGRVRGVRLRTDEGERACASRVAIDATGRARALARRAESESRSSGRAGKKQMPLVAFKAHLEGAGGADGVCEIYFYRGGYGGLSPVEGGLSNLCFIARSGDVRARASDAERVMREVVGVNRRAAETLGGARVASEWLSVALEGFGRRELAPCDGLLAVGDAASFIDPFTGSGMLMALESGKLAAETVADWLPRAGAAGAQAALGARYRALYGERFDARLRVCAWLRRAAFAPHALAEAAVFALGASGRVRCRLARATRHDGIGSFTHRLFDSIKK